MIHAFRYDDFSSVSSAEVEERFFGLLAARGMKCTVAVVPAALPSSWEPAGSIPLRVLTAERARSLCAWVDRGVAEVALHGYAHAASSSTRGMAEFGNAVSRNEQRALLAAGRRILEDLFGGIAPIFVPPWNVYTAETLRVLKETGFSILSAAAAGASDEDGIRFLPATATPERSVAAVRSGLKRDSSRGIVVTNVHDYDFEAAGFGSGRSWAWWERELSSLAAIPGVEHLRLGDVAANPETDLGARRLRYNALLRERVTRFPGRWLLRGRTAVYWPAPEAGN